VPIYLYLNKQIQAYLNPHGTTSNKNLFANSFFLYIKLTNLINKLLVDLFNVQKFLSFASD